MRRIKKLKAKGTNKEGEKVGRSATSASLAPTSTAEISPHLNQKGKDSIT